MHLWEAFENPREDKSTTNDKKAKTMTAALTWGHSPSVLGFLAVSRTFPNNANTSRKPGKQKNKTMSAVLILGRSLILFGVLECFFFVFGIFCIFHFLACVRELLCSSALVGSHPSSSAEARDGFLQLDHSLVGFFFR